MSRHAGNVLRAFPLIILGVAATLSAQGPPGGDFRGGFDPQEMIKRMDVDGSGAIEPKEMEGRARYFLDRLAREQDLDLSKPIPVEKLKNILRERMERSRSGSPRPDSGDRSDSGDKNSSSSKSSAEKKGEEEPGVPGFGETLELALAPGFGEEADAELGGQAGSLEQQYGRKILDYVDRYILNRYDKDKNGSLERSEWKDVKWSSDPNPSDANQDGTLTRGELAARTQKRWGTSSSGDNRSRSSSGGSSSSSSSSANDKIRKFADSLLKQHDKNKNGVLEGDELKGVRDPKTTDRNSDGRITKEELIIRLSSYSSNRSSSSGSSSSRPSSSSSSSRSRFSWGKRSSGSSSSSSVTKGSGKSYRVKTPTEKLPSGLPSWFARGDQDGDGQVMMHEFATAWSSSKVSEFAKYDLNNDGVVTPAECKEAESGK
ncbi:MAG: hypothetical protein N2C14_30450 [Planctomycetales bacterium]